MERQVSDQPPSIATLSEVPTVNLIHLEGAVKGQKLVFLMDTGATHNFISNFTEAKRKFQVNAILHLDVKIAGGDLNCSRMVSQLEVQLGSYTLTANFYVIEFNMICYFGSTVA